MIGNIGGMFSRCNNQLSAHVQLVLPAVLHLHQKQYLKSLFSGEQIVTNVMHVSLQWLSCYIYMNADTEMM